MLQNPTGLATLGTTVSTVTLDDDETATLSIQATDTATEAGGVQTTDVTLSLAGSGTGTLSLAAPATAEVIDAGGGSAISGADYTALVTQTVTFATGSTNGATQSVSLTPIDDLLVEGAETIKLALQNPTGLVTLATTTGTVTIDDNESASLSIQATDTATEQGGVQTTLITLTLVGSGTLSLASPVTADVVDASGGSATSGADYTPLGTQTVSFPAGSTSGTTRTVSVTPLNDLAVEGNETVNLALQNPTGPTTLGTTASAVTIDDDDTASLSIQTADTAAEEGGAQTTDVTLALGGSGSGPASLAVALSAQVIDATTGSALSGTDYTPLGTQTSHVCHGRD